jgi:hypothetical protein
VRNLTDNRCLEIIELAQVKKVKPVGMRNTFWSATDVWARMRPFEEAPVRKVTEVLARITPSRCAPAPITTEPETTQIMFAAFAPPASIDFLPAAMFRVPATWKIQAVKRNHK